MTINETVKWFNSIFDINRNDNWEKKDFCIGLTSDIEKIRQDREIKLLGFTQCTDSAVAENLIKRMQEEGFGFRQEVMEMEKERPSLYVYLYKTEN